jgi:hypothetical protein
MPALAALAVAAVARFGGSGPVRVAISGIAGPALLAIAYVIGAPGGGTQTSSYQYALLGVAVAAAVSVLVAVARKPPPGALRKVARIGEREPAAEKPAPRDEPWVGVHRHQAWTDAPDDDETWPGDDSPTDPITAATPSWAPEPTGPDETTDPLPAQGRAERAKPAQGRARVETAKPEPEETTEPIPAAGGETAAGEKTAAGQADETTEPLPAAATPQPPPAKRRGRRRGQDKDEQAVPARDSDYVDWVRALGGSGGGDADKK